MKRLVSLWGLLMRTLNKIKQRYFTKSAVQLDWKKDQAVIDGQVIIGAKAGPECNITNLIHEMAHFVEIDEDRMNQDGWGLRTPTVFIYNRYCIEPKTIQMTEREIRVMAYQANIFEAFEFPHTAIDEFASAMRHMPDFCYVPLEDGSSAYGDDRTHNLEYQDITKSQIKWIRNQVEKNRSIFSFEKFESEWFRRNKILKG